MSSRSKPRRPASGYAWPWTIDVRRLLAFATLLSGLAMLAVGRGARSESEGAVRHAPELVVDLNSAPVEVFSALPGIGPKLAAQIVEARRESPFVSLDDLDRRTRGIGPATVARLAPHLRIEPPQKPVASPIARRGSRVD
ncbi:MAG: helix-hairpin-helix domain-containing protein [Paludisphaera borealis]|uniref:ComEA family DNA-binding protein n=1 Tax=Paludisphaera borealis TaxID=1387353 RepID=UPI002849EC38|nr:helix-hairpin-helix domain-containing protein [Paludisphaera borealis]MDR3619847.1 helix-hairpin-helix domain-containing protein [Paludisphaera borealis]